MTNQVEEKELQGRWYLLTAKPGQETWALQNLRVNDHEAWLPTWRRPVRRAIWIQRRGKRTRTTQVEIESGALFPGYLFVKVHSVSEWPSILSTHGVRRLVGTGARPMAVQRGVVELLMAAEVAGLNEYMTVDELDARLLGLEAGDPVTVTLSRGMADLKAIFVEQFDDERAVVLVSLCGCESRVKVSKSRLSAGSS